MSQFRRYRLWLAGLLIAAATGVCGAISFGTAAPASASAAAGWTSYDLSTQNGVQVTGQPSLATDPSSGQQDIATATPSGGIELWQGDGASGASAEFVNANSNDPVSQQSDTSDPTLLTDPLTGDLLIFSDTQGGYLEEYDRQPSSDQWDAYNISTLAGQLIDGTPSAVAIDGEPAIAASNNNDLVAFTRTSGGSWSAANLSSSSYTGENITNDMSPTAIVDPQGYLDVVADNSAGDYTQFADISGTWDYFNQTPTGGGNTISGDPTAIADGQELLVFANSANGDLIEYERPVNGDGTWDSVNLTTAFGGPTIDSDPSAVIDGSDIDVFAEGADDNLIEYTDVGDGWTATDLTTADGADQIAAAPAATISATTGNLVVFGASPSGDLVESELATPPASSSTTTSSSTSTTTTSPSTSTSTVVTAPSPTHTSTPRKRVKVTIRMYWIASARTSELRWVKLGTLKADESVSLVCRGTGPKHTTGCLFKRRSASGKPALRKLVAKLAKTHYGAGDVLTLTVSEPGLKPYVAKITIRKNRLPTVTA